MRVCLCAKVTSHGGDNVRISLAHWFSQAVMGDANQTGRLSAPLCMRVPRSVSLNGIRATSALQSLSLHLSLSLSICVSLSLSLSVFLSLSPCQPLFQSLSASPCLSPSPSLSMSLSLLVSVSLSPFLSLSLTHTLTPHHEMPLWTWEGIGKDGLTTLNVWCPWQSARCLEKTEAPLCSGHKWGWAGKGWLHEEGAP